MVFWQHVVSILKSGSTMDDMVDLMVNGHGCAVPVIMNVGGEAKGGGHAFFTMGTPTMLEKGWMSRFICPGMSNRHHGSLCNNEHSVPYNVNNLMSPTHCIIIGTNAAGQNTKLLSNDNDGIYFNPQMVTNTLWLRGVPKCEIFCLPPPFHTGTPHMVTGTVSLAIHLVTH